MLLDLNFFDLCSGALIPDVMHDLLEGALRCVIIQVLEYCINEKKFFSIAQLNNKIKGIELGYLTDDNRPAVVGNLKDIRQNGNK